MYWTTFIQRAFSLQNRNQQCRPWGKGTAETARN